MASTRAKRTMSKLSSLVPLYRVVLLSFVLAVQAFYGEDQRLVYDGTFARNYLFQYWALRRIVYYSSVIVRFCL